MSFRRNRRGLSLRPVNRIKHVMDIQGAVVAGGVDTQTLIRAVDNPVRTLFDEVQTGATVNAIYLNVEAYARTDAALSNFYISIGKNPGNNLTFPTPNQVGISDNKKFIIHQEMKILQRQVDGNPRTIFNGVIVIPKHYRRFGPEDRLNMNLHPPGINVDYCIQCHYKEFR